MSTTPSCSASVGSAPAPIPKRLRIFFRYDRSALDGLSEAATALGRNERLQLVRTQLVIPEWPCSLTNNDRQKPGLKPNRCLPTAVQDC